MIQQCIVSSQQVRCVCVLLNVVGHALYQIKGPIIIPDQV
jgi:hypothetical protein